jgi:hypothetical protein
MPYQPIYSAKTSTGFYSNSIENEAGVNENGERNRLMKSVTYRLARLIRAWPIRFMVIKCCS